MHKKYYTISEVSKILEVKEHTLRNLDEFIGKKLTIIRGRRYYKEVDIEKLRKTLESKALISGSNNLTSCNKVFKSTNDQSQLYELSDNFSTNEGNSALVKNDTHIQSVESNNIMRNLMRSMNELRAELLSALE